MKNKVGHPQHLQYLQYLDCKKRTKKQIGFLKNDSNDEILVRAILANSSVLDRDSERSFRRVSDAIDLICKQLCPGEWCTRSHCKNYSSTSAYNCETTRPKVCKEYAKYIEKKKAKEELLTHENGKRN